MEYRHVQWGYVSLLTIPIIAVVVVSILGSDERRPGWLSALIGLAILLIVGLVLHFSRMETLVTDETVSVFFGRGWPRREIELTDVFGVEVVRNKWWYGWGIRKVPEGWMYNVWGLDAVELVLSTGTVFRIGSDEPDELAAVIALQAHH